VPINERVLLSIGCDQTANGGTLQQQVQCGPSAPPTPSSRTKTTAMQYCVQTRTTTPARRLPLVPVQQLPPLHAAVRSTIAMPPTRARRSSCCPWCWWGSFLCPCPSLGLSFSYWRTINHHTTTTTITTTNATDYAKVRAQPQTPSMRHCFPPPPQQQATFIEGSRNCLLQSLTSPQAVKDNNKTCLFHKLRG
jgi:hypothetical protein